VHSRLFPRLIELACISGLAGLLMAAAPLGSNPVSSGASTPQSQATNTIAAPATIPTKTADHPVQGGIKTKVTNSIMSGATVSVQSKQSGTLASKPVATHEPFSAHEEDLAKAVKFDRLILSIVKDETHERLQRLVGYDENGYRIVAPGIAVTVPAEKAESVFTALRAKLRTYGYQVFIVEKNDLLKIDKVGVIKGTDQYEIVRIMHTDGDEDTMVTDDIIDRLKEWEKISSFEIIGADNDWVELEFSRLPRDLKAFGEDIYDFSPDAVDEGQRTVEGLLKELVKTKRLFLSW